MEGAGSKPAAGATLDYLQVMRNHRRCQHEGKVKLKERSEDYSHSDNDIKAKSTNLKAHDDINIPGR